MKKPTTPVVVSARTFGQVLADASAKASARDAKLAAMTEEEQQQFLAKEQNQLEAALKAYHDAGGAPLMMFGVRGTR